LYYFGSMDKPIEAGVNGISRRIWGEDSYQSVYLYSQRQRLQCGIIPRWGFLSFALLDVFVLAGLLDMSDRVDGYEVCISDRRVTNTVGFMSGSTY
jgi:hypothetical protein